MKKNQESIHSLFQPTFGNRPEKYIGRDGVIEAPRRGELVFAVPYLAEYLLAEWE
jgi:hypothetical protein